MREIRPGAAFEPTYIYRLLTLIESSLSEKVRRKCKFATPLLPFAQKAGLARHLPAIGQAWGPVLPESIEKTLFGL